MAGRRKAAKAGAKGTKKSASAKRRAPKPRPAPKAASVQVRSARDPYRGPSQTRIEQSLHDGTTISLSHFRSIIKWS